MLFNQAGGNGAAGGPADLIKDTTTATFMADVIEASMQVPVIVDFWAPWCGPCKTLGPQLEKLVKEARGAVRMVKVNVDQNQELAMQLRVQSIPMVYAFKGGRPVDAFVGAQPESQIKAFVKRLIGEGSGVETVDDILAEARQFMEQGDVATASAIYTEILAQDPKHPVAAAGLARCHLSAGDADGARAIIDGLPADVARHAEVQAVRAALELAGQAKDAGETAELRRRVAQAPDDHQARFDLAMAYYGNGENEAAIDSLLEIVRRDRTWNEDGARKQLVKIFEALGHAHPLTVATRKRLSSLLFS